LRYNNASAVHYQLHWKVILWLRKPYFKAF
jgi:hypothetical protein